MRLLAYTIEGVQYLLNPNQIKEAGSLKAAAEKMAGIKPKEVVREQGEKKPIEK